MPVIENDSDEDGIGLQRTLFVKGERTHDDHAFRFVKGKGTHANQAPYERGLKSYCNLHVVSPVNYNYCRLTTGVQIDKGTILVHLSSRLWNF